MKVLADAQLEWDAVCRMEATAGTRTWLHCHCLYTTFQCYREFFLVCEKHECRFNSEIRDAALAWNPPFGQSANLESMFREMESCIRKTGCAHDSLPNLGCVAVRSLERRIAVDEQGPSTVRLSENDWCGKTIRGLKYRMFNPSGVSPCLLSLMRPMHALSFRLLSNAFRIPGKNFRMDDT